MGTGIIIDPRGYIITNHHVVEDVNVIRVRLADGTVASARVLARDPESDLALLKIDAGRPLPVMPLGTASDLMVGETVHRHRQRLRLRAHRHRRHRQRHGPGRDAEQGRLLQVADPDRRQHQPRQLGRSAAEHQRRADRRQRRHPGRRPGHRLRHSRRHHDPRGRLTCCGRAARAAATPSWRTAGVGLAVRDALNRPTMTPRRCGPVMVERVEPAARPPRRACSAATSSSRSATCPRAAASTLERGPARRHPGRPRPGAGPPRRRANKSWTWSSKPPAASAQCPPTLSGGASWACVCSRSRPMTSPGPSRSCTAAWGQRRPSRQARPRKAGIQRGDILVGLHQWEMLSPGQRPVRAQPPRPGQLQPAALLHPPGRPGPPRLAAKPRLTFPTTVSPLPQGSESGSPT